ncbi:MAG: efflux RND transporter periplasmic adaptor subunit [Deltaproteobacteria bacterium]|nr:efflux RND transporter periplasmic adaptor subunit [Deltaproteobacteria bacterium]
MKLTGKKNILIVILILILLFFTWEVVSRIRERAQSDKSWGHAGQRAVPVEVAEVTYGQIELRRTFSGTLESPSSFLVAPKISGRIEILNLDIGDTVTRNQVVARLDDAEYEQAVLLAEADLAVANANKVEAESAFEIAERELKRVNELLNAGLASDSEHDSIKANNLAKQAQLAIAMAQEKKAEASLETARIRQSYTKVVASWAGGDNRRTVGERFVNEGDTVSANTPLLSIVEIDPIQGIIYVSEKDYAYLKTGQSAFLTTDAHHGETFEGKISRIAPVFQQATRQARIELKIANPDFRLKPGMFIRATIIFDRVDNAYIVPAQALTKRENRDGVFVVNDDHKTVRWCPVTIGIREEEKVQIECEKLKPGHFVITLGQQLLEDGADILISEDRFNRPSTN